MPLILFPVKLVSSPKSKNKGKLPQVLKAMQLAHPYEEVAYDLYELQNTGKLYSIGRVGFLPAKLSIEELASSVKQKLGLKHLRVVGELNKKVKKIAVIGGSGSSFIPEVIRQNVDVLITGDVKYHEARDAENVGLAIIDAGHQGTEEIMAGKMAKWLQKTCLDRDINIEIKSFVGQDCFKLL